MGKVEIDWKRIRPLRGSQQTGFEELCCQIARIERHPNSKFVRVGTPDGGVECYATLDTGDEWGWQAKFFNTLDDPQWPQIDDSVKRALDTHPRLVLYHVCAPTDLADPRSPGRRYAKDRWDEHEAKWSGWASAKAMRVEFVFWGESQLLEFLSRREQCGRLRFWFDVERFNDDWFKARLDESIHAAGPRYTPELHVELPIASEFEAFGRNPRMFDDFKKGVRLLRRKLGPLENDATKGSINADDLPHKTSVLVGSVQQAISSLIGFTYNPIAVLPFRSIIAQIDSALTAAEQLGQALKEGNDGKDTADGATSTRSTLRIVSFREQRQQLAALQSELLKLRETLVHADALTSTSLLILIGRAGTGKTHLFCDVASTRLKEGRPTVLLMGQRFLTRDDPWEQVLRHVDLQDISSEEFIGALEAAAEAAGCRALLMIDAVNEGEGRNLWPAHFASFLARIKRSDWISVALSVRTPFEGIVIPEDVRKQGETITHLGFAGHEFDAARTFFTHYKLELPSAPLLVPEFRNPLFLKVLCEGLSKSGQNRLPRGSLGISHVFALFIDAVNRDLAIKLDFDEREQFVHRAIDQLSDAFEQSDKRWLSLADAKKIVNGFLADKDHSRSLFFGLVSSGVLLQECIEREGGVYDDVVLIAYERLADHLLAQRILERNLDDKDPAIAFKDGGALAYIGDRKKYLSQGLLEALLVQVPERTGRELVELSPSVTEQMMFSESFLQSLIWRTRKSFSKTTSKVLNTITSDARGLADTIEVLLTVATVPDHPLNANALHDWLSSEPMSDRDAHWSVHISQALGEKGAVDRLIAWAWTVAPSQPIEDETVDLCAISLAWMLTASNRAARDRATKALVNLLTGRTVAAIRLVERFTGVDDPYVAERVYAVAYGVAMRSHDTEQVGRLAQCVFDRVFRDRQPPPHILLRDYARGVVEQALYLGATLNIDVDLIRPPYRTPWPHVPTEVEIKSLLEEQAGGSYDGGDLKWGRTAIRHSVMDGDFARYVIGTNGGTSNWLIHRFDDPPWVPYEERLAVVLKGFSQDEVKAWKEYESFDDDVAMVLRMGQAKNLLGPEDDGAVDEHGAENEQDYAQEKRRAVEDLQSKLTAGHAAQAQEFIEARQSGESLFRPPYFDLGLVQRYVLWRVFNLGWTVERFGHFDRFLARDYMEGIPKTERVGKKYQWIAYHEIMAYIADNYQYHGSLGHDVDRVYRGPWQDGIRDIDPSCTLKRTIGGTSSRAHTPAWWSPVNYQNWDTPTDPDGWREVDDPPSVEQLLSVTNPDDGSRWLNLEGDFVWQQPVPADSEPLEVERRDLWLSFTGYLLKAQDAPAFMVWAEGVDFWGRWMPRTPTVHNLFLGEHPHLPAARYFRHPYFGDEGWTQPANGCPVLVRAAVVEYLNEAAGNDESVDERFTLGLPAIDLVNGLALRWTGREAEYVGPDGHRIAYDPTASQTGPSALLVRQDALLEFLAREKLTICWVVLAEKRVHGEAARKRSGEIYHFSGAYLLDGKQPRGSLRRFPEK